MSSDRRQNKIDEVLLNKQPTLELFLDNIHDSHNLAAIIRSCDAVGILNIYYTNQKNESFKTHKTITQGAHRWVNRFRIKDDDKIKFLKQKQDEGYQIVATHIEEGAVNYTEIDYTKPTMIITGNEKEGVSDEIIALSNQSIKIPMKGMVQSLNVSVATALILYEAQRQLEEKGRYQTPQLTVEQRNKIKEEWIYRDTIARRSKGKIPLKFIEEVKIN